jgi:hypothetical protein
MNFRKQVGPAGSLLTATGTSKGPTYAQTVAARLAEAQSQQDAQAWTADEELIITAIQQAESVPRTEAIRRMQRKRKASRLAMDRAWYAARLDEPWLLDFSIPLRTGEGFFVLAVPTSGRRRGGLVSFASPKYAELAAARLAGNAGFPKVRIEHHAARGTCQLVRWGEEEPTITERDNKAEGQIGEHRAAGEFYGYSDSAIRTFLFVQFGRETVLATERLCRNPQCTRGDDGGPGSLAHLRADARYCDDTCKKAGQRSLRRENEPSNRQCLCGSRRDKSVSVALPLNANECAL